MITTILPNGTPMTLGGFATAAIPNILLPQKITEEEDRDLIIQCCYNNLTLAGGNDPFENDISSFLCKTRDP